MKSEILKITLIFSIVFFLTNFTMGQNIALNPGFEDGIGELPDSWTPAILEGSANFSWSSDVVHSGDKSICITHTDSATSSFYQIISVYPSFEYKVSAYIKTEDVEVGTAWFEGGAQIVIKGDVEGDWWDNMTDKIGGNSDWTKVTLEFTTTEDASVIELHCNLGAGLKIKGTAWYDDIIVEGTESIGSFFRNGGFEEDTLILNREDPNWDGGWFLEFDEFNSVENGYVTITLDTTVYHGGRQSLKFYCVPNRATGWMQVMQNGGPYPEGLVDGAFYKISGWIKTEGDVSHIRMRCGNNGDIGEQLAGDNDWTYREGIIEFDQAFYDAWGFLGLTFWKESIENSGTVWYDDIKVERVQVSGITDLDALVPRSCELVGNYPNPFNPNTTFLFKLNRTLDVKLTVFNKLGKQVAMVLDRNCQQGEYRIDWNAAPELSSGVYFYELKAGNYRQIKKMILMR